MSCCSINIPPSFHSPVRCLGYLGLVLAMFACGAEIDGEQMGYSYESEDEVLKTSEQSIRGTRPVRFQCTQVIGFSQTNQWFSGSPDFEEVVNDGRWQLLWKGGSSIDLWADPEFAGWSQALVSPCARRSGSPDRVVLTISGDRQLNPEVWAAQIQEAIYTVEEFYPRIRQIVLQPVVGGPDDSLCRRNRTPVRATVNHPVIDEAIQQVVGGKVVAGFSPEVMDCSDYRDVKGHLSNPAIPAVARAIAAHYAQ